MARRKSYRNWKVDGDGAESVWDFLRPLAELAGKYDFSSAKSRVVLPGVKCKRETGERTILRKMSKLCRKAVDFSMEVSRGDVVRRGVERGIREDARRSEWAK